MGKLYVRVSNLMHILLLIFFSNGLRDFEGDPNYFLRVDK